MALKTVVHCFCTGLRFNVLRRRHHCRSCGRVLCARCSRYSGKLEYLGDNQEARICEACFAELQESADRDNACTDELSGDGPSTVQQENEKEVQDDQQTPDISGSVSEVSLLESAVDSTEDAVNISTSPDSAQCDVTDNSSPQFEGGPRGILKSSLSRSTSMPHGRSVVFADGVRPGTELATELDPGSSRAQRAHTSAAAAGTASATPGDTPRSSRRSGRSRARTSGSQRSTSAMVIKPSHSRPLASYLANPVLPVADVSIPGGKRE